MELLNYPLIITVNQRLARALRDQLAQQQADRGQRVWKSTEILPWSSWITALWRSDLAHTTPRYLLSQRQALHIWEKVIRNSPSSHALLHVTQTSRLASEAWKIMHEWQVPLEHAGQKLNLSLDQQTFREWKNAFSQELDKQGWITSEQIPDQLVLLLDEGKLRLPEETDQPIIWAGFDLLTPQQRQIQTSLINRGFTHETYIPPRWTEVASHIALPDGPAEIQFSAQYCREQLQQNPAQKIGVVVPELNAQRDQIAAVFSDQLGRINDQFSFSIGEPLAEHPLIHAALQILRGVSQPLDLAELSQLLRSPFLGEAESERQSRSRLDAHLRERGIARLNLMALRKFSPDEQLEPAKPQHCPALFARLDQIDQVLTDQAKEGRQGLHYWWTFFQKILDAAGWPGQRSLSSEEYQAHVRWQEMGEAWLSDQIVLGRVNQSEALQALRTCLLDQDFKAESPDTPVQILGHLEATHLPFDQLLVLGLSDDQWPARVNSNPFLPRKTLIDKAMPLASSNGALHLARLITERFAQAASKVIFTYPQQAADQPLRPSALMTVYPEVLSEQLVTKPVVTKPSEYELDKLEDFQGSSIDGDEVTAPGGTGLFKDQAACAFRAYARYRLRAHGLDEVEPALSATERGSLVHRAMEILWGEVRTQSNWLSLSETDQLKQIKNGVETAMRDLHSDVEAMELSAYQELESVRLVFLIRNWMEIESSRSAFEVIDREKNLDLKVGKLSLNARIDRIDQLDDQSLALIDYKTGAVSTAAWEGERPEEPQLPLYAIGMESPPQSILYASLKRGKQRLIGVSGLDDQARGIKTIEDWPAQISEWQSTMVQLADDFCAGDARVNPLKNTTCQYCDLQSFCRVDELIQQAGEFVAEDESWGGDRD